MLKGIDKNLSPDLIKILMEMGHGDEIVIADGNYPAASNANKLVRLDGLSGEQVLKAVLSVMPLDEDGDASITLMNVAEGMAQPEIWGRYRQVLAESGESRSDIKSLERFAFYEQASKAYAIVATGETAIYANLILRKGVIKAGEN